LLCNHDVGLEECVWPAGDPCDGALIISNLRKPAEHVIVRCSDGLKYMSEHKIDDYRYNRVEITLKPDKPLF
jgi:hypothetical protein